MKDLYSSKLHVYFKDTWKLVHYRVNKKDVLFQNEGDDPSQVNSQLFEQCLSNLTYAQPSGQQSQGNRMMRGSNQASVASTAISSQSGSSDQ